MSGPEFPNYTEAQFTGDFVAQLKMAGVLMLPSITWQSSDGYYLYTALPEEDPEMVREIVPTLENMTAAEYVHIFNAWHVSRLSRADLDGKMTLDNYYIGAGYPLAVSTHEVDHELLQVDTDDQALDEIISDANLQLGLGFGDAEVIDYAAVENALFDLRQVSLDALHSNLESRANMTDDERRWERARRYSGLVNPEVDKLEGPNWWAITETASPYLIYAVYAQSPDIAAVIAEERLGTPLFMPSAELYPEERQQLFGEKFEGRELVQLIPGSTEEWGEDYNNMTDAQKKALEDLNKSI